MFQSVLSKSLSLAEMSIKGEIHPPTLYVYETVELDLSLQEDEMESHHITLHAGMYVVLPLLYELTIKNFAIEPRTSRTSTKHEGAYNKGVTLMI